MADSSSTAATAASNPLSSFIGTDIPPIIGGVVRHPDISAPAQVEILSVVDQTGSVTIGDIVDALPGHDNAVGATLALVAAGVLTLRFRGVLDENTIVSRASRDDDPDSADEVSLSAPVLVAAGENDPPAGLEQLDPHFVANVIVGPGDARRAFARMDALHRPGVYCLVSRSHVYVGMGGDVGQRVSDGHQPIADIEAIFAVTDTLGRLTSDDALIAERNLSARIAASGSRKLVNNVPIGGACDVQLYSEIDSFIADAVLRLHHQGFDLFGRSARSVLAGPRAERGRIGAPRAAEALPTGELHELNFGSGLVAHAARQKDGRWLLLAGSHARIETAPSCNRGIVFSRAAWLHSGLLALASDAKSYVTTRDLYFATGSAAGQFCSGVKGRPLASWRPIDPDGEDRPVLVARAAA